MTKNSKWKNKFLSSGIPLEFEAAKLLVEKGFAVDFDYTYSRQYDGFYKDSSVDILARGYLPLRDNNNCKVDSLTKPVGEVHRQYTRMTNFGVSLR